MLSRFKGRSVLQQYHVPSQQLTSSPYGQFMPDTIRAKTYGSWGGTWVYKPSTAFVAAAQHQPVYTSVPASSSELASGTLGVTSHTAPTAATAAYTSPVAVQQGQATGKAQVQGVPGSPGSFTTAPAGTTAAAVAGPVNNISSSGGSSAAGAAGGATVAGTAPAGTATVAATQPAAVAGGVTGNAAGAGGILAPADSSLPAGFDIPNNTLNINAGVVTTQATAFGDGELVDANCYPF